MFWSILLSSVLRHVSFSRHWSQIWYDMWCLTSCKADESLEEKIKIDQNNRFLIADVTFKARPKSSEMMQFDSSCTCVTLFSVLANYGPITYRFLDTARYRPIGIENHKFFFILVLWRMIQITMFDNVILRSSGWKILAISLTVLTKTVIDSRRDGQLDNVMSHCAWSERSTVA